MSKDKTIQENETTAEPKNNCAEYLNGWKRALADYENLKKQMTKEKGEFAKFATLNFVVGLIPVYEHLLLSFDHLPKNATNDTEFSNWVKGVEHIKNQFKEVLEFNGVEEIVPAIGEDFSPELHEAVEHANNNANEEESNKVQNGKITKVLSSGFKLQGRVFKPARVIVQ